MSGDFTASPARCDPGHAVQHANRPDVDCWKSSDDLKAVHHYQGTGFFERFLQLAFGRGTLQRVQAGCEYREGEQVL